MENKNINAERLERRRLLARERYHKKKEERAAEAKIVEDLKLLNSRLSHTNTTLITPLEKENTALRAENEKLKNAMKKLTFNASAINAQAGKMIGETAIMMDEMEERSSYKVVQKFIRELDDFISKQNNDKNPTCTVCLEIIHKKSHQVRCERCVSKLHLSCFLKLLFSCEEVILKCPACCDILCDNEIYDLAMYEAKFVEKTLRGLRGISTLSKIK